MKTRQAALDFILILVLFSEIILEHGQNLARATKSKEKDDASGSSSQVDPHIVLTGLQQLKKQRRVQTEEKPQRSKISTPRTAVRKTQREAVLSRQAQNQPVEEEFINVDSAPKQGIGC